MLSSLRARLFLTYTLLITVILFVVGLALIIFIVRNPIIDREIYTRMESIADFVIRQGLLKIESRERLKVVIERIDQQGDVRVLVLSSTGEVLLDSRAGEASVLIPKIRKSVLSQRGIAFDEAGKAWYMVWEPVGDDYIFVLATQRVRRVSLLFSQRLGELLRDDLLPPLIQGGLIALILALILSFWMTNWITSPLRRMFDATQKITIGEIHEVPVEGPKEIRSLAQSFNAMTHKVVASQRSQRDFVANVSHELKTPLTSIHGFAQALVDGTTETKEDVTKAADVILSEAERMHRLVLDLLHLAKLEAGTIQMGRHPVDVDRLLRDIVESLEPKAVEGQISLVYQASSPMEIIGDGDRLKQVFTNLVDNAIKFTPPEGSVTIRSKNTESGLIVSVEDTGIGIPNEETSRIFERFYQVERSRAGLEGRGTGLGLSIAREIVKAHEGDIEVRSEVGKGSSFKVFIPYNQLHRSSKAGISGEAEHA